MLNVIMVNVIRLNVIMFNTVMLNVIMMSAMAPLKKLVQKNIIKGKFFHFIEQKTYDLITN